MISEEKLAQLCRSRDTIRKMAEGYAKKAAAAEDEESKAKYTRYAEDLDYWFRDSDILIPRSVFHYDGTYICPSCHCRIGDIYEAAAAAELTISCCICCGQTFNGLIGQAPEEY